MPIQGNPSYDVRIYAPDGKRRRLETNAVQPGTRWKNSQTGGYAEATFLLSGSAANLLAITENDRVRVYAGGANGYTDLRYSGLVSQVVRAVAEPLTLSVTAQGVFSKVAAVPVDARFITPFPSDVAQIFASFANVEARAAYPALNVDIGVSSLGITAQIEDAFNKSLGDTFRSLAERFQGLAVYGCDELPTALGATPIDRLFLRAVGDKATPDYTIPVPGVWQGAAVSSAQGGPDVSKLANIVTVTGSDNQYPNLLAQGCKGNVGFERPVLTGANNANRFLSPSFDTPGAFPALGWGGSFSVKVSGLTEGNARSGKRMAELDAVAEDCTQTAFGSVVAGATEVIGCFARREFAGSSAATFKTRVEWYNAAAGGGTLVQANETTYAPDAAGLWTEFSAVFTVPTGAVSYIVKYILVSKTGSQGVVIDDCFAYRAGVIQDGWQVKAETTAVFNVVNWAATNTASQGRYSVAIDVSATDDDGYDARIEPLGKFPVTGNTSVRFAADLRAWEGASPDKIRMELRFFDSGAGEISGSYTELVIGAGTITTAWTQYQFTANAPGSAAYATARITFRGDSKVFIDRLFVRNAAAPQLPDSTYEWVDDGPYRAMFSVADITGLSVAAAASITNYGKRYEQIQSDGVYNRETAIALLSRYFEVYAIPLGRPQIVIADSPVTFLPGQTVRLAGENGGAYLGASGGVPIAEVSESVNPDGQIVTTLALEVVPPTLERMVFDAIKRGRKSTTGGGVSSFSGGGGGGNVPYVGGGKITARDLQGNTVLSDSMFLIGTNGVGMQLDSTSTDIAIYAYADRQLTATIAISTVTIDSSSCGHVMAGTGAGGTGAYTIYLPATDGVAGSGSANLGNGLITLKKTLAGTVTIYPNAASGDLVENASSYSWVAAAGDCLILDYARSGGFGAPSKGWWVVARSGTAGAGTVTSVGLTAPSLFGVAGSPVTSAGTLALTFASQSANLLFASPNGAAGVPTMRTLALADIANLLITGAKIADATLAIGKMNATGTPSATTFLRGDNTWAVPAGGGSVSSLNTKTGAVVVAGVANFGILVNNSGADILLSLDDSATSRSATGTLSGSVYTCSVDTTGGAVTLDISALALKRTALIYRSAGSNPITLNPGSGKKVNGLSTYTFGRESGACAVAIRDMGADWMVVGSFEGTAGRAAARHSVSFFDGTTPATGVSEKRYILPFGPGGATRYYVPVKHSFRVETTASSGNTTCQFQFYSGTGAFSGTTILQSQQITAGNREGAATGGASIPINAPKSGDKIALNVSAVGTGAALFNATVEFDVYDYDFYL